MTTVTLERAQKELATLIERARAGEEIVIETPGGQPPIGLNPEEPAPSYRGRGLYKSIKISEEDLFGPLPDDELRLWNGDGDDP